MEANKIEDLLVDFSNDLLEIKKQLNELVGPDRDEWLTRKQVKEIYNISYPTIHKLMNEGKLASKRLGRKRLFKRTEVNRLFENEE